ncbi:MAG TPA: flavin reductase family protein [Burkholderiaceae bacterium]
MDPKRYLRARSAHPTDASLDATDPLHLRECLGTFATGVAIITAQAPDGSFIGLTANSFNSLSLTPPLVLWSLGTRSGSLEAFIAASHFSVNVLSAAQVELALRFSRQGVNRFAGVPLHAGLGGAPLIDGAIGWFECETQSHARYGDHVLFIGAVRRCARTGGNGLVFHHGGYRVADTLPPEPSA